MTNAKSFNPTNPLLLEQLENLGLKTEGWKSWKECKEAMREARLVHADELADIVKAQGAETATDVRASKYTTVAIAKDRLRKAELREEIKELREQIATKQTEVRNLDDEIRAKTEHNRTVEATAKAFKLKFAVTKKPTTPKVATVTLEEVVAK